MEVFEVDLKGDHIIGKGGFTVIRPAYKKNAIDKTLQYVAKLGLKGNNSNPNYFNEFNNELLILSSLDNKNIIKFYGLTEVENDIYLILEYCNGGDLNNFRQKYKEKNNTSFKEKDVLFIIKEITNGLYYLSKNGITHHQIIPSNILFKFDSEEALENLDLNHCSIKISGFRLAKYREDMNCNYGIGGTPIYMDPKIIIDRIKEPSIVENEKVDVWSLGILSYKLLFENHPFIPLYAIKNKTYMKVLNDNIKKGIYSIPNETICSKEYISFIDFCLKREQNVRKSLEELINSRFLTLPYEKFNFINKYNIEKEIKENLRNEENEIILNIYNEKYFSEEISFVEEKDEESNNFNNSEIENLKKTIEILKNTNFNKDKEILEIKEKLDRKTIEYNELNNKLLLIIEKNNKLQSELDYKQKIINELISKINK